MANVNKRGAVAPEMNMTPLIDVTFQLIIFFMLVNNIVAQENVKLLPPELEDPKTSKLETENRVVVNVAPRPFTDDSEREVNPLAYDGAAAFIKISNTEFSVDDLAGVTATLKALVAASEKDEDDNPTIEVLLRADAAVYYEEVQRVMAAITEAKIQKVNLVAYLPEDQR